MIFILLLFYISHEIFEGGWQTIPVDSESVQTVKPYLDMNVPRLFPEYENVKYNIASARIQIVSGVNLELIINSSSTPLSFVITLYVNIDKIIQLKTISKPIKARPIIGGYVWQNPSHFTQSDLYNATQLIQKDGDLIVSNSGQVLAYRTKSEKGLKTHIIFRDERNTICSAVIFKNLINYTEQLISVKQVY